MFWRFKKKKKEEYAYHWDSLTAPKEQMIASKTQNRLKYLFKWLSIIQLINLFMFAEAPIVDALYAPRSRRLLATSQYSILIPFCFFFIVIPKS